MIVDGIPVRVSVFVVAPEKITPPGPAPLTQRFHRPAGLVLYSQPIVGREAEPRLVVKVVELEH